MRPAISPLRNRLLALTLLLGTSGCTTEPEPLATYPVSLHLGGSTPADGRVGDYQVTFSEGWIILGDWWIYGMNRETAGYAMLQKHAGHAHGEAALETHVEGTFAVNLLGDPAVIATHDLTEGHYFDGSFRLRPCTTLYAPVRVEDGAALSDQDALWGHSLILTGTATTDGSTIYEFQVTVDAEAMIAGLVYGSTVWEHGADVITTRLDLGALLADVDFAALADPEGLVRIEPTTASDTYTLIKARLQNPQLYRHSEAEAIPASGEEP